MSKIYISELASPRLIEYLLSKGHCLNIIGDGCGLSQRLSTKFDTSAASRQIHWLKPAENVDSAISCHPDILYCHLAGGLVFHGNPDKLERKYPADSLYNGCSTGRFFIHNLHHTAPELLAEVDKLNLQKIHAAQGYSRCSILPVNENSIITSDRGIASACARADLACVHGSDGDADLGCVSNQDGQVSQVGQQAPASQAGGFGSTGGSVTNPISAGQAGWPGSPGKSDLPGGAQQLNVLLVSPGHIVLPGYASGFIGGTGGRIDGEVIFNGDLSAHPDFAAIKAFIESRGLRCVWFDDVPLTDIGSIVEEKR